VEPRGHGTQRWRSTSVEASDREAPRNEDCPVCRPGLWCRSCRGPRRRRWPCRAPVASTGSATSAASEVP